MRGRRISVVLLALCLSLACGCAGYRLGTTLPPGIKSIYVPTFVNQTGEPELEQATTRATIQEFQQDGALRIASEDTADARIEVQLKQFSLEPLRYSPDAGRATSEYRLVIIAQVDLYRNATGARMSRGQVRGESTFEPSGDLSLGKLDALPKAAEDLAHHIVQMVVEYW